MMPMCENILDDLAASFWLKNALQAALNRDPVDALNDAELLVVALKERLDFVFNEEATE